MSTGDGENLLWLLYHSRLRPGRGSWRRAANTPETPAHIQRPFRHLRSISSSPRPSEMPVTKPGCFVTSEEFSSRSWRRLDRVSAADRPQRHEALQSARSRASSVDGLLMCEFARFCARRVGGTCRRSPARVSGEGRLALSIAPAQARKKLVAAARRAGHGPAPCDSGEQLAHNPSSRRQHGEGIAFKAGEIRQRSLEASR